MSTLATGHHRYNFTQDLGASMKYTTGNVTRQLNIWVKFREKNLG